MLNRVSHLFNNKEPVAHVALQIMNEYFFEIIHINVYTFQLKWSKFIVAISIRNMYIEGVDIIESNNEAR